jgi:DNA-binding CsgD family transcriptional regulator
MSEDTTVINRARGRQLFRSELRLTQRQLQVLGWMAEGLTNAEMAGRLFLSPASVRLIRQQVLDHLEARNAAHAVHQGHLLGILLH